jgi:NAD(P)-dependent dehydrogenase (short-subunit alcohol dehydrogenase family)
MSVLDRFRLDGKVAVVTGASKNIGLEISRAFAELGAHVVMVARGEELLVEGADGIRAETGARVDPIVADVGDKDDVERIIATVHADVDQIDVLVNNAAQYGGDEVGVLDQVDEVWEEVIACNLMGPMRLSRGFGRPMRAGRGGSIINVLSGQGLLPSGGRAPYAATKSALWMMTRSMVIECAPKIRVNVLCPGVTSATGQGHDGSATTTASLARTPMGRVAAAAEIAPAAVYLASDAASYTTGALLLVNGGRDW